MGLDVYSVAFFGAKLNEIASVEEKPVKRTKYNEDTGKPYEITEYKYFYTIDGKDYLQNEMLELFDAHNIIIHEPDCDSYHHEKDFVRLFSDVLIGVEVCRSCVFRNPYTGYVAQDKLIDSMTKVNDFLAQIHSQAQPQLYITGYSSY